MAAYYAHVDPARKLIRRSPGTSRISIGKLPLKQFVKGERGFQAGGNLTIQ